MTTATMKRLRRRLAEAQNWRCAYCGVGMSEDPKGLDKATLDHVVTLHHGGSNAPANLVVACFLCNEYRQLVDAEVFHELRCRTARSGSWPVGGRPKKQVRQKLRKLMGEDVQWARKRHVLERQLENHGLNRDVATGHDGHPYVLRLVGWKPVTG